MTLLPVPNPMGNVLRRIDIAELMKRAGFQRTRILNSRDADNLFPTGSVILSALSCHRNETSDNGRPGEPHGIIAPFARRNYYLEAASRLRNVCREMRHLTGWAKQDLRIFCNSRQPEKSMASLCGLGFYGKNSLIIHPELGSRFIIAGLFVPSDLPSDRPLETRETLGRNCGECRRCLDACPVQAIPAPGRIDASRCIQALSTQPVVLPEDIKTAWRNRVYGCETCQSVCPFNRCLSHITVTERGNIGASVPLKEILNRNPVQLRTFFRGTVLDRSWIPAESILRNAVLAGGHRKDPSVRPLIERFSGHPRRYLADAAAWSLDRY